MREWLSGGASPCQGEGRGFDPRLALYFFAQKWLLVLAINCSPLSHFFEQREVRSTSQTPYFIRGSGLRLLKSPSVGSTGKRFTGPFSESVSPRLAFPFLSKERCKHLVDPLFHKGFGSPAPKVAVGRFDGKKVHRTFFLNPSHPVSRFGLP